MKARRSRSAGPIDEDRAAGGEASPVESDAEIYLYGIVRWPLTGGAKSLGAGVGDPPGPVRAVRAGELAALVSDVFPAEMEAQGVRGMRRDMKAHSLLLSAVAAKTTVLPVRFGVVLPDERSMVERILLPRRVELLEYLDHLEGANEVTFRATYVEQQILREVLQARPELASRRAPTARRSGLSASAESQIELGRQVAMAIQEEREHDANELLQTLKPAAKDVRIGKPQTDLMVLNASFLVERAKLAAFDRLLERINASKGSRMTFDCVGPLPPFSFADLRL